ncbi:hypothetical protein [Fodinibius sp.]|nr:hypothetical protein [Fodinibius sp.]MDZ7659996.1 hypothetical protein [Fodinibius sp.]
MHAYRLAFKHPRHGKEVQFEAKIPADMMRLIDRFRWKKEAQSG